MRSRVLYVAKVPAGWQTSSYCGEGEACVNVAVSAPDVIKLRESDAPDVILTTTLANLRTFIRAAKAGRYDSPL
ncbi:DUF397 domain-containing protein [Streptomyces sp. x-80]|uniref:DUF397 domain-containing protein n=1 Tax=Streptomyces sp. x-80 TaxID=2789282 RepID=UPI00398126FD